MGALRRRGWNLDRVLLAGGLALLVLAGLCWATGYTPLGDRMGGSVGDSLGGAAVLLTLAALVALVADALRASRRRVLPERTTRADGLLVVGLTMLVLAALCVAAAYSPLGDQSNLEAGLGWLIGALLFAGVGVVVLVVDALRAGWRALRHHGGRGGHGGHGGHGRAAGAV